MGKILKWKHFSSNDNGAETHSRLEWRQRSLKLWCDQLKRLKFDIKLLVSTRENVRLTKQHTSVAQLYYSVFSPDDVG